MIAKEVPQPPEISVTLMNETGCNCCESFNKVSTVPSVIVPFSMLPSDRKPDSAAFACSDLSLASVMLHRVSKVGRTSVERGRKWSIERCADDPGRFPPGRHTCNVLQKKCLWHSPSCWRISHLFNEISNYSYCVQCINKPPIRMRNQYSAANFRPLKQRFI